MDRAVLARLKSGCPPPAGYNVASRRHKGELPTVNQVRVMATIQSPSEQHLVLYGISWQTYERLLRVFADRPGVRLTYDRGALELMTLSHEHESLVHLLGRLVVALQRNSVCRSKVAARQRFAAAGSSVA